MKVFLFLLQLCLISIKANEDFGFVKYKYSYNDKPVFDIEQIMEQPPLPGISDENWPYNNFFVPYSNQQCKECSCGVKFKNRIVNGSIAQPYEFPWQVLITRNQRFICGGSLVNDLYVVTAAHCMFGFKKDELQIRLGIYRRHTFQGVFKNIDSRWIDKKYVKKTHMRDISIIKLQTKVRFTQHIKPICLPKLGSTYAGDIGIVTGWGRIYFEGPVSEVLRKVQLPILSNAQCRRTGYKNAIKPTQLCAGNNGKDSCSGDSGGPLQVFQSKRYRLAGIVSYGRDCNIPNYPGVYTRVTKFYQQIVKLTSRNGACWCSDSDE